MAFTYRDMGHTFHEYILCIFHNGWVDCRDAVHVVLCLHAGIGYHPCFFTLYLYDPYCL